MKELLELLEQYGITSPGSISQSIRVMGRTKVRNFLEDLNRFGRKEGALSRDGRESSA